MIPPIKKAAETHRIGTEKDDAAFDVSGTVRQMATGRLLRMNVRPF